MSSAGSLDDRIGSLLPYVTIPTIAIVFLATQFDFESSGTIVRYAFTVLFGIPVAVGVAVVGLGLLDLRDWWTMRRLDPAGPTAEYDGLCAFEGIASPVDDTVTTPFTETESLVSRWRIEKNRNGDASWDTVREVTDAVPFEVEDAGSTIAVDPTSAQTLLTTEYQTQVRHDEDDPPAEVAEFFQRLRDDNEAAWELEGGAVSVSDSEPELYRFTEERLDDGESVHVVGTARGDPGAIPDGSSASVALNPTTGGWRDRLFENPFLVSDGNESTAERRQLKRATVKLGSGLVGTAVFSLFFVPIVLDTVA